MELPTKLVGAKKRKAKLVARQIRHVPRFPRTEKFLKPLMRAEDMDTEEQDRDVGLGRNSSSPVIVDLTLTEDNTDLAVPDETVASTLRKTNDISKVKGVLKDKTNVTFNTNGAANSSDGSRGPMPTPRILFTPDWETEDIIFSGIVPVRNAVFTDFCTAKVLANTNETGAVESCIYDDENQPPTQNVETMTQDAEPVVGSETENNPPAATMVDHGHDAPSTSGTTNAAKLRKKRRLGVHSLKDKAQRLWRTIRGTVTFDPLKARPKRQHSIYSADSSDEDNSCLADVLPPKVKKKPTCLARPKESVRSLG